MIDWDEARKIYWKIYNEHQDVLECKIEKFLKGFDCKRPKEGNKKERKKDGTRISR